MRFLRVKTSAYRFVDDDKFSSTNVFSTNLRSTFFIVDKIDVSREIYNIVLSFKILSY